MARKVLRTQKNKSLVIYAMVLYLSNLYLNLMEHTLSISMMINLSRRQINALKALVRQQKIF